ncbi:MerC domain-containing protein [Lacinutrix sp. C3R15]|uniref:MerC domain-containing protein n=1 Tax=Flavobacteriaceae TaxID=49546 RepID=UPI001C09553F|nr:MULTISPECIES: MerC domain-containing protein [Flavobacteriaceae]MBU2938499.1 MerC domain-containing protein [Lacinutrix sp. C3R15]MDO6621813.1 MerC domain-containing protein [Oceanihabitans sp. 1_MG-2023]
MIIIKENPDNIGALASTLCLIHCVATPFIFIAQSCSVANCSEVPTWWGIIDYLFLILSFFAVYRTTKTTSINRIKPMLWFSFFLLFAVVANEKYSWFYLNENFIYVPAIALIALHIYNRKYCQCKTTTCCTNEA